MDEKDTQKINQKKYAESKLSPITHYLSVKVAAFVLFIIAGVTFLAIFCGIVFLFSQEVFFTPEDAYRNNIYEQMAQSDSHDILIEYLFDGEKQTNLFCSTKNIGAVSIIDSITQTEIFRYGTIDENRKIYTSEWEYYNNEIFYFSDKNIPDDMTTFTVRMQLKDPMDVNDLYSNVGRLIHFAYTMRYLSFLILLGILIFLIFDFVFLLSASGHHKGEEKVRSGYGTFLPADLLTAITCGAGFVTIYLTSVFCMDQWWMTFIAIIIGSAVCIAISLGWCMSIALRVKMGILWKHNIIYYVCRFIYRIFRKIFQGIWGIIRNINIIWKTILILFGISFLELMFLIINVNYGGITILMWFAEKALLVPLLLYFVIMLKKLKDAGKKLAAGELGNRVSTENMILDLKEHGKDLNSIGIGMHNAVEKQLKSERMKTELITNVSHDIKTPLTSIINYADLIEKNQEDKEKIKEYAGVLHRQSEKLKNLINDLVEASKASTGNIEVNMAVCEIGVLLTQAAGEYEERFMESMLEPIVTMPQEPVRIMADGRRLWRVFDNLLNNICKYGQSGTRVYLTVEKTDRQAVIIFKNTSHEPLNMSAEELMERFTRGDSSRHTEGSGLGLSIARSLTELQNGTLELVVDGDLFKAILKFNLIMNPKAETSVSLKVPTK